MDQGFNLYRDSHKAIRMYLAEFSLNCGRCDFSNNNDLAQLKLSFKNVYDLFMIHTVVENDHILPQIKKLDPELYETMEIAHESVDETLKKLKSEIESISTESEQSMEKGYQFYLHFNRFIAENLSHLDEEERIVMPLLWKHITNEELIALFGQLRADIPQPLMQGYLKYMIPSVKLTDMAMILKGIKAVAPPEAFKNILNLAKNLLNSDDFILIESHLE